MTLKFEHKICYVTYKDKSLTVDPLVGLFILEIKVLFVHSTILTLQILKWDKFIPKNQR